MYLLGFFLNHIPGSGGLGMLTPTSVDHPLRPCKYGEQSSLTLAQPSPTLTSQPSLTLAFGPWGLAVRACLGSRFGAGTVIGTDAWPWH